MTSELADTSTKGVNGTPPTSTFHHCARPVDATISLGPAQGLLSQEHRTVLLWAGPTSRARALLWQLT